MSRMSEANQGQGRGSAQQIRETASQVGEGIREVGSQVRDVATDKYNELRDQAQQYYEEGRQRAIEWERGLEEYVQEKPIQSLLIAAGVGLLLGLLWKRS